MTNQDKGKIAKWMLALWWQFISNQDCYSAIGGWEKEQ